MLLFQIESVDFLMFSSPYHKYDNQASNKIKHVIIGKSLEFVIIGTSSEFVIFGTSGSNNNMTGYPIVTVYVTIGSILFQ